MTLYQKCSLVSTMLGVPNRLIVRSRGARPDGHVWVEIADFIASTVAGSQLSSVVARMISSAASILASCQYTLPYRCFESLTSTECTGCLGFSDDQLSVN